MFYQPQEGSRAVNGVTLLITETQRTDQPTTWDGFPLDTMEEVIVGNSPATFARGAVVDGIYNPGASLSLAWNATNLSIRMRYSAPSTYPARLGKDELIVITENME